MALVDTEQITPLEEISKLYSSEASIIEKISKKWSDRTKNDANPWPKNGSWDLKLILQMEGKIYDHKHKETSEVRETKRKQELLTLRAFMKIAKNKALSQKQSSEQVNDQSKKREHEDRNAFRPPPYVFSNESFPAVNRLYPQLPVVQGAAVGIQGTIQGEIELTHGLEKRFGQMMNDVSTVVHEISCKLGEIEGGSGAVQKRDQLGNETPQAAGGGTVSQKSGGEKNDSKLNVESISSKPGSLTINEMIEGKDYSHLVEEDREQVRRRYERFTSLSTDMISDTEKEMKE